MIQRTLAKILLQRAKKFPVVAVLGPRQSGKTTLVKAVFPDKPYVNLEDPDTRAFAEEDPRGFLGKYSEGAIFDEIQRVPHLFSYLQGIVDRHGRPGEFILTGSHHFLLHQHISQTLAGRVSLHKLLPCSIQELLKSDYRPDDLDVLMRSGGYPRLFPSELKPEEWYPDYIQTFIERDVRQIKDISDLSTFQRFIRLCAARIGQLLNLSSLATECGISVNTAKSWISVLETSFIIVLLQSHHRNFNKRLVKMPKLYFVDTGVACSLLGIATEEQLSSHYLRGNLFENLMIIELMKWFFHEGKEPSMYFWRDKTGHEVDLLIERGEKLLPLEIKSGKTINSEAFSGLEYWQKLSGARSAGTMIYAGDEEQQRKKAKLVNWRTDPGLYIV